jgi:hypothetical protein
MALVGGKVLWEGLRGERGKGHTSHPASALDGHGKAVTLDARPKAR